MIHAIARVRWQSGVRRIVDTVRWPKLPPLPVCVAVRSQILQLNQLAPEIQEQLLFLPPTRPGSDRLLERHVRSLARMVDWRKQRQLFQAVREQLSL